MATSWLCNKEERSEHEECTRKSQRPNLKSDPVVEQDCPVFILAVSAKIKLMWGYQIKESGEKFASKELWIV